ncbi:helix-hairpin-helix domain-containing protein [Nocardia bovistercoris]|uniref:helix-hairpin-helix domain-containing protein n=1 Tax=Nocardia bovistercoris TaxID=2785916 RepID=UPI002FCD2845
MVTLALVGLLAAIITAVVVFREQPVAQAVPPVPSVRTSSAAAAPSGRADVPRADVPRNGADAAVPAATPAATGELVVSVVGLVRTGGLKHLPAGARVADAITAAGGALDGADLTSLNLAQRLGDGDQVLVGPAVPDRATPQLGSTTINAASRPTTSGASHPAGPTARVDLNKATESDLDALPGVGPVTARAIVAWRTTNGRFTDVEQLGDIDGIGPARLTRLRELVTV